MELNHNNRVLFDPVSHSYLLDGEKLLMGVTELMKKHGLSADYSGVSEATLKKAAAEGTAIHREIQEYEEGKTVFASELIDEYKQLGLKFVEAEYPVSDYETCASAIDCVYEGDEKDTVILVDIKCTQKYHRNALEAQLGIYKVFFERQNPKKKVVGCYCLWIDKKKRKINGLIPVEPMPEKEVNALLECEKNGQLYVAPEKSGAELILSDTELATYASSYDKVIEFKEKVKQAEEVLKEFDGRILKYLQDNNLEEMNGPGGITFKVKKAYDTTRVDANALKTKYPAIYAKVTKKSTTSASLLVSKKEE